MDTGTHNQATADEYRGGIGTAKVAKSCGARRRHRDVAEVDEKEGYFVRP